MPGDKVSADEKTYSLQPRNWYRLVRGVIGLILHLLCRLEIEGLENIPDEGGYLVLPNHLHWLDPPMLAVSFPHRAYVFAAAKWAKHWFLGPFFRSLDAIFVQRGEVDRRALRQALDLLQQGGVLGLAPEGTRSKTGGLQKGRSGAAYIAYRAGAGLIPVAITGQEKVFPCLRRFRRATVHVIYGPFFAPPPVEGKATAAQVHAFSQEIMYRLAALLPPEYRGVYADVEEERPELVAQLATQSHSSPN
jgi:1-acyl-sn-glycerol-3-phosphate acyltransferase